MMDIKAETDEYQITREKRSSSPYEFDFVLYFDGEEVITASEVERRGEFGFEDIDNWTRVLRVFGDAYSESSTVDAGMQAVLEEYQV